MSGFTIWCLIGAVIIILPLNNRMISEWSDISLRAMRSTMPGFDPRYLMPIMFIAIIFMILIWPVIIGSIVYTNFKGRL